MTPDELKARQIISMVEIVLDENKMENYTSYVHISHHIANLIDQQFKRLNENNKLQDPGVFKTWMEIKMS